MVILVTGRAGAGKTHYANGLAKELQEQGHSAIVLDSDEYRRLFRDRDFSDHGRVKHLLRLAMIAAEMELAGAICIVAAICPRKQWRILMRSLWKSSKIVYMPGGNMWTGTTYEVPDIDELFG